MMWKGVVVTPKLPTKSKGPSCAISEPGWRRMFEMSGGKLRGCSLFIFGDTAPLSLLPVKGASRLILYHVSTAFEQWRIVRIIAGM